MAETSRELVVRQDGEVRQRIPIGAAVVNIGRLPDSTLSLADPLVSRRHAEVHVEGEAVMLTDLDSRNGTFVNGVRLLPHQPHALTPDESVRIGPFALTYELTSQEASEGTALPAEAEPAAVARPEEVEVLPALPPAPPVPPRPCFPAPVAHGPVSGYLEYLPVTFQNEDFLGRYLLIMETLWEPLEQRQDQIAMYFDARTCPVGLLPWLASWLDLPLDPSWPENRQRRALGEAMELYRWRGTSHGVMRAIELFTGVTPDIVEDDATPFVFHVRVRSTPEHRVDRFQLEALIRTHKPAHAGFTVELS